MNPVRNKNSEEVLHKQKFQISNGVNIFVFGNEDLEMDSLPLRILPRLKEAFPAIRFELKDPNEEWGVPEEMVVLDTALGIKEVRIFDDLEKFVPAPRVGIHDFDALANLRFLLKLGKIKKIKIIGVPPGMTEEKALDEVGRNIELMLADKNI